MRTPHLTLVLLTAAPLLAAADSPPDPTELLLRNTYTFSYTSSSLSGPGADFLREKTAHSQFVLIGEAHMDHEVPIFAGGLFAMLHAKHGFQHLVVEQDPIAMEETLAPERRGDVEKLAALSKRYPSLFEFPSDEDLTLLADVSRSRAERLLGALAKSAEIFNYYTRAEAGEFVGLYNNTVREEVLKGNFLRRYHAATKTSALPKALFKFGSNHMYHGRNSTNAFPIGNLAHELAIVNGMEGYGLTVIPLGKDYISYKDLPGWMIPLLPATEPTVPTIIDLRSLRPYQRLFRLKLANQTDAEEFRMLIHGYEAIVLLPNSKPSAKVLGGRGGP